MTGLSLNDGDRLALAAAGVSEGPDGSLRSASGAIVSPGVAAALISRGDSLGKAQSLPAMSTVDPGQFRRGYITAGHAPDSPANGRRAAPVPPEGGERSASLCTTPPDDGGDVEKVVEAGDFRRGPLTAGQEAPSPGDMGDNNPVAPVTGSGHAMYEHVAETYNANSARERAQHVAVSHECVSRPAPAQWSPPPDLGAANLPQPRARGRDQEGARRVTAADEADTHARKARRHAYVAAALERQAHQQLTDAAREWAKAGRHRELEIAAREAAAEAAFAAVTATHERTADGER